MSWGSVCASDGAIGGPTRGPSGSVVSWPHRPPPRRPPPPPPPAPLPPPPPPPPPPPAPPPPAAPASPPHSLVPRLTGDSARPPPSGRRLGFRVGPGFTVSGVVCRPADGLPVVLAVAAMIGMWLVLRHSRTGVALRGAA